MWLIFRRKSFFFKICSILLLWTKMVVYNKSKFSSGFSPFQTCWEKQIFWVFLCSFLRYSMLVQKKRSSQWISPKMFQTNRKALCGSFWGQKQSLLIFDQKELFKQIQIFLTIYPFSNVLRKTKFLSIFVLLSEIVTFWTKKWSFQWIIPNMIKKIGNHSLAVFGTFC